MKNIIIKHIIHEYFNAIAKKKYQMLLKNIFGQKMKFDNNRMSGYSRNKF